MEDPASDLLKIQLASDPTDPGKKRTIVASWIAFPLRLGGRCRRTDYLCE